MIPSDEALAMAELSADAVFGKIPEDRYLYYISNSLLAGEEASESYAGMPADELSEKLGVSVVIEEKSARLGAVDLRAQARTENGRTTIHIYRESLELLAAESAWDGYPALDMETVLGTHIFHELFHVLEERNGYVSDKLDTVRAWKLLSYENRAHVVRCSEIAAHRFAQKMLSLPWLPVFYDYIYLIRSGKLSMEQAEDFFTRMERLVSENRGGNE